MNFDVITSLALFVLAIAALILIHELGHFLVARLFKIEIEEFGIGFPPRAITLFEAGGTKFTLNWLPLGGFVRPKGENDPTVEGGLAAASPWARITVLIAGPAFNIITAIILFAIIFARVGMPSLTSGPVEILEVAPDSPAAAAGLLAGDLILQVNETIIDGSQTLQESIQASLGQETTLIVQREGGTEEITLTPRTDPPPDQGAIGIVMRIATDMRPVPPGEAILLGAGAVYEQIRTLITLPASLAQGTVATEDARLVGYKGMFDIYQNLRETEVEAGTPAGVGTLFFAATISVSLGLLNLLPIPALDGGRILFTLPEILFRRRIPPAYESMINVVSLALLLLLMLYINVQDFVNPAEFLR